MSLADLVDHVIGVDSDRDRITAAVVCARTRGGIARKVVAATARGYGQAMQAAFARLGGVAPLEATSGQTQTRH